MPVAVGIGSPGFVVIMGGHVAVAPAANLTDGVDGLVFDNNDEALYQGLKKIIENPQYKAPILKVNPEVKNFYDFKVEDFELIDYNCTPLEEKIEVAV